MGSQKSRPEAERQALEPQRERGKLRVAALMQAGAAVIAEKGFEAATMAEIALRAGAPIGSLYRFFPNKEVLADALLERYGELVKEAFAAVDSQLDSLSVAGLADALLALLPGLHGETRAVIALLEAHSEWSARRGEFRRAVRQHLARVLMRRNPSITPDRAGDIAVVLLQNMKAMKTVTGLRAGEEDDARPGTSRELREMTRLYLEHVLG